MKFINGAQALFLSIILGFVISPALAQDADAPSVTHAKIQTSKGDIIIALYTEDAPVSVQNFLTYATKGHYDRTIFHRVVGGYVIQGGGYSRYFNERTPGPAIKYEGDNGRKNLRGTIAMARGVSPESAQAQWFINLRDNEDLDHFVNDLGPRYGYAVFGEVVEGLDVVDAIGSVTTGEGGPFDAEVPLDPILILRVDPADWSPEDTTEETP